MLVLNFIYQFIQVKSTIFYANLDHKTVTSQCLIFFYGASQVFYSAFLYVEH